jgi:7,8-dihydropterin-6-yl-methyl-4-(beta-D-ribofuranosyl)aminobenzene 5'-phosphate synthase
VEKPLVLHKGITLYPAFSLPFSAEFDSCGLTRRVKGQWLPDDFLHEQYLEIIEGDKRILFSGCSHRGILNIIEYFKPDVFFGGFHLNSLGYESDELRYVSEKLSMYNTVFYTCHCTGIESYSFLKTKLKANLNYLNSGKCVEI